MEKTQKYSKKQKAILFVIILILYVVLTVPLMFKLTNTLFSYIKLDTQKDGCPTIFGIFLHAVVLSVIVMAVLYLI